MANRNVVSLLLLDDNQDLVAYYEQRLKRLGPVSITTEVSSLRARSLAQRQLFDLIVIDAKLDYRGFEFGGLRLADDLRGRYGSNSILIISRYITASMAQVSELQCEFMEKSGGSGLAFERALWRKLKQMKKKQYAFVAMPFSKGMSRLYSSVRRGIEAAGLKCVRVDKLTHTRPIQEVVFDLVEKSKVVVFVADGGNPNAYYEAGFADAMRKEVIVVAKAVDELPFDIRNRNAVIYGDDVASLAERLRNQIAGLRLRSPVGAW
jgi:CheY-like chemotaxis protein